ncbi:unnamed protein product, partial [Ectocarpus sp. 12 AP-2014]
INPQPGESVGAEPSRSTTPLAVWRFFFPRRRCGGARKQKVCSFGLRAELLQHMIILSPPSARVDSAASDRKRLTRVWGREARRGPELRERANGNLVTTCAPAAVHVVDPSTSPPTYCFSTYTFSMIAHLDRYHLGVVVQSPADLIASLWHD